MPAIYRSVMERRQKKLLLFFWMGPQVPWARRGSPSLQLNTNVDVHRLRLLQSGKEQLLKKQQLSKSCKINNSWSSHRTGTRSSSNQSKETSLNTQDIQKRPPKGNALTSKLTTYQENKYSLKEDNNIQPLITQYSQCLSKNKKLQDKGQSKKIGSIIKRKSSQKKRVQKGQR